MAKIEQIEKLENRKNKFIGSVKKIINNLFGVLSTTPYHDDEMGVDTRSKADRHFQGTGKMYELEMENAEKDIKYFIDKSNEADGIK